ncbi:hypothetical protein FHN55_20315 [Streptomyces sp. NP160]|uniref:GAP family protein n=1 Tax=Streptomyces sp. NP160 TaxID=2586637 RepID=UPI001118AD61|nr:GAP family protein [Streptomyces sp. NP160]TNM59624.1 hypothetical protein FHN55_20315 [Streptomyces sp. NP160]
MSGTLLAGITGLALLDALNPATIGGVALLLAPLRRPAATASAFVAGAYAVVLALGCALFLGAGAAAGALDGGALWVRRAALTLAGAVLLVVAVRRLRTRRRAAVTLPGWVGPWTAAPLGVLVTGADLPNAFPYLIAVERLVAAQVPVGTGVAVLAGYAAVYCLPCLVLLVAGLTLGQRVRDRLQRFYDRFGSAREVPRSVPTALALAGLGVAVVVLAWSW